jgi:DNA-binding IclR family transcriptional regulator
MSNAAQTRLLTVIEALAGNEVFGLRLKEVADAAGAGGAASTILRDLQTLEAAGWAQQSREGRWMLAARPIQVLHHFYRGRQAAECRVAEVAANYTKTPV